MDAGTLTPAYANRGRRGREQEVGRGPGL